MTLFYVRGYLNQAKIDSITVNENQVIQSVDQWMNMAVNQIGSREKLEEYFGKKFSQIKDERKEMVREQQVVQQMQHQLIGEIKLTPSEVRKYFSQLSQDSLPNIPTTVEVQIVTLMNSLRGPNTKFSSSALTTRISDSLLTMGVRML